MNPDLPNDRNRVELLAQEFLSRRAAGEDLGIDDFVDQHPDISLAIRRKIIERVAALEPLTDVGDDSFELGEPVALSVGKPLAEWPKFSDYRILREIARGGMGIVFEAEQISLGRLVALKTLPVTHQRGSNAYRRFQIEAKAAAQLHHSNIVPVYEVGQENGVSFYAMQFIRGQGLDLVLKNLRRKIKAGERLETCQYSPDDNTYNESQIPNPTSFQELEENTNSTSPDNSSHRRNQNDEFDVPADIEVPTDATGNGSPDESDADDSGSIKIRIVPRTREYWRSVARIGEQIAEALHHAHQRGIIHRDIKPSNLILDRNGTVWISDFGLAKLDEEGLTKADDLVGTLLYMSPERFDGICDLRGDIYSLGMTLYELLALRPPFRTNVKLELLKAIRDTEPRLLRSLDPNIPRDLQTIVNKAMTKEATGRYQSADELAKDLARFIEGRPIHARHVTGAEKVLIWSRRNPWVASLAAALFAIGLITLIGSIMMAVTFRQMALKQTQLASTASASEVRAIFSEQKARQAELAAKNSATRANEAASLNARNLYYAEMNLAIDAVADPNGVRQTREILDRWIPNENDAVERRGWEWYLLDSIVNPKTTILETGQHGICLDAQWSHDGTHVAWASGNEVCVCDFPKFEKIQVLRGYASFVMAVAFSPDGRFLATGSNGKRLRIWDWKNGVPVFETEFQTPPGAVCWSPDGSMLVVQAFDRGHQGKGAMHVFESAGWNEIQKIDSPDNNDLFQFCFDPTGKFLATRFSGSVRIISTDDWSIVREKHFHNGEIVGLAWHPSLPWIATASRDGWSRIWDMEQDTVTDLVRGREQSGIDWHPDGSRLALGNWDFGVRVVRPIEKQLETVLNGHSNWVNSVAWHPGQELLLSGSNDGTVRIWDLKTPTALRIYRQTDAEDLLWSRGNICWSPDGKFLATESNDLITLRDASTGSPYVESGMTSTFHGSNSSWSSRGNYFASKFDGEVTIRDAAARQQISKKVLGEIRLGSFSPVLDKIVLVDSGEINETWQLKIWDIESDEIVCLGEQHKGQHTVMPVWNPDGTLLATAAAGNVYVIDSRSGQTVHSFDASNRTVIAMTWSPDGQQLALAGRDQRIVIRDTTTWEKLDVYSGHTYQVVSLSWSPDGSRLASGSVDRTVRVWDTVNGQSTIKLQHDSPVTSVQWSSDSRQLASMSDDGVTKIWDASAGYERGQKEPVITRFEAEGITISRQ